MESKALLEFGINDWGLSFAPDAARLTQGSSTCDLDDDYWDREGVLESESAGDRRTFLRFSFWANLLLRRFRSPGFRKNACFFTSLIMPSCCT